MSSQRFYFGLSVSATRNCSCTVDEVSVDRVIRTPVLMGTTGSMVDDRTRWKSLLIARAQVLDLHLTKSPAPVFDPCSWLHRFWRQHHSWITVYRGSPRPSALH